jgi:hypothetical protein
MGSMALPTGWKDLAQGAAILACNIPAAAKVADDAPCQEGSLRVQCHSWGAGRSNAQICG